MSAELGSSICELVLADALVLLEKYLFSLGVLAKTFWSSSSSCFFWDCFAARDLCTYNMMMPNTLSLAKINVRTYAIKIITNFTNKIVWLIQRILVDKSLWRHIRRSTRRQQVNKAVNITVRCCIGSWHGSTSSQIFRARRHWNSEMHFFLGYRWLFVICF